MVTVVDSVSLLVSFLSQDLIDLVSLCFALCTLLRSRSRSDALALVLLNSLCHLNLDCILCFETAVQKFVSLGLGIDGLLDVGRSELVISGVT
jgi:hypothetical protein